MTKILKFLHNVPQEIKITKVKSKKYNATVTMINISIWLLLLFLFIILASVPSLLFLFTLFALSLYFSIP